MAEAKFEIRRGRTGKFRFVLIDTNGEPVCVSETYTTKAKTLKGIDAVRDASRLALIVDTTAVVKRARDPKTTRSIPTER